MSDDLEVRRMALDMALQLPVDLSQPDGWDNVLTNAFLFYAFLCGERDRDLVDRVTGIANYTAAEDKYTNLHKIMFGNKP
jgi:hypothetical protein